MNGRNINSMSTTAKLQPCIRRSWLRPSALRTTYRQFSYDSGGPVKPNAPRRKYTPPARRLPQGALAYHWDTLPPTHLQLNHASKFFTKQIPKFLWSAEKFKTMEFGKNIPEVCFLGRSNVGKSSLLNALLCRKIANTSSKPGRTKLMNAFGVGYPDPTGSPRLVVMDMPGYGKGGRAEWGTQIMKYLEKRRELTRAFLLIDAEHGIKPSDRQLLQLLKDAAVPYQVVLSKVDRILLNGSRLPSTEALLSKVGQLKNTMQQVREAVQPASEEEGGAIGEVISCSSLGWIDGNRIGIDALRFAMLRAAGLELKPERKTGKPVDVVSHEDIPFVYDRPPQQGSP